MILKNTRQKLPEPSNIALPMLLIDDDQITWNEVGAVSNWESVVSQVFLLSQYRFEWKYNYFICTQKFFSFHSNKKSWYRKKIEAEKIVP